MKTLCSKNIVDYLNSKLIIDLKKRIEHEFAILELKNNRNTLFKVQFEKHLFLVKQLYNPFKETSLFSIKNEILFWKEVMPNVPKCLDEENQIIILEIDGNAKEIQYLDFDGEEKFSNIGPKIAESLFKFHKTVLNENRGLLDHFPHIMSVNHISIFLNKLAETNSFYCLQLKTKIEEHKNVFLELGKIWEKTKTLIHQDLKPTNFISNLEAIEIVDFEFVGEGSFYWDLADHLFYFLRYSYFIINSDLKDCNPSSCRQYSQVFLDKYLDLLRVSKNEYNDFYRNALAFFVAKMSIKFYYSIQRNNFNVDQEYLEYKRIMFFWEVIENFDNPKFDFTKYAEQRRKFY